jgi:hypothetical protein
VGPRLARARTFKPVGVLHFCRSLKRLMTSLRLNGTVYGLFAVPSQEMTYLRWLREADTEPVGSHNATWICVTPATGPRFPYFLFEKMRASVLSMMKQERALGLYSSGLQQLKSINFEGRTETGFCVNLRTFWRLTDLFLSVRR